MRVVVVEEVHRGLVGVVVSLLLLQRQLAWMQVLNQARSHTSLFNQLPGFHIPRTPPPTSLS